MKFVKYSDSGAMTKLISLMTPRIGELKNTANMIMPAPRTSPKSIIRSLRNGRVLLIPQAAFIPFRMAPKAAVAAHSRPHTLAIPVMARADTTP